MDAKNYPPTYPTSRRSLIIKTTIGVILLGMVTYAAYVYFLNPTVELTPDSSYQTNRISDEQRKLLENTDITGYIQLTQISPATADTSYVRVINYNPSSDTFSVAIDDGNHMSIFPISSSTGTVLEIDGETGETYATTFDFNNQKYTYLPLRENQLSHNTFPSADGTKYAMDTFYTDVLGTNELDDMGNWNIRIYDSMSDSSTHIQQATSPQWFNDYKDIIFLKKDGLYRYNLESGETKNIFNLYTNLSGRAQVAVSDVSNYLVLTLPSANTVSVLRFDDVENSAVREVARKTSDSTWFRSPVFAPNGTQFALISVSNASPTESTTPTNTLEAYSILDLEPILSKDMGDILPGQLSLTSWKPYEIIAPYRAN